MFVVDTNVLLHAVNPDSPDHQRAHAAMEAWRPGDRSWFLTWGIVYEFLRVSTHLSVFPDPLDLPSARSWIALLLPRQSSMLPMLPCRLVNCRGGTFARKKANPDRLQ